MTKFYTLTVDTEEEWDWSNGYDSRSCSVDNIEALPNFQETCERFGAKVTYFVNYSVLTNVSAAGVIKRLDQRQDVEIGYHIHPWNTPPFPSSDIRVSERESYLHNLPRDIAIQKMDSVLEAFRNCGLSPSSFRGGRYSTSDWIQEHLYKNGCIADASVVPFTTWPDDGAPDFRHRDLAPHRRDMGERRSGLWELPLTLAFTRQPWKFWSSFYESAKRQPWRSLRCIGIAERLFVKRVWLNLENPLGASATHLLNVLRQTDLPCINITLHSSSLVPGLNAYTRTQSDLRRLYSRLEDVLSLLGNWSEFRSATVAEVA